MPAVAESSQSIMDGVRTLVSLIGAVEGFRPTLDIDAAQRRRDARICAVVPTLIMSLHRLATGQQPIEPRDDLGYGANYLWMLTGTEPDPEKGRGVEQYQITTIDHGFNASTFTARVITSTGADVAAAVAGRIGALPDAEAVPRRGRRAARCHRDRRNARPYLVDSVNRGERIMGFGHRVDKTDDPRSLFLRGVAERIGAEKIEFAKQVEQTVVEVLAELKPGRNLYANVEFYAGVVMDHCGLPRPLFTPTFASSRVIGWCANIPSRRPTTASSGRPPATSARRRLNPCPTAPRPDHGRARRDRHRSDPGARRGVRPAPSSALAVEPSASAEQVAEVVASPATDQFVATTDNGRIAGLSTLVTFRIPMDCAPGSKTSWSTRRPGARASARRSTGPRRTEPASAAASPSTSPAVRAARPPTASTSASVSPHARPTSTGSTLEAVAGMGLDRRPQDSLALTRRGDAILGCCLYADRPRRRREAVAGRPRASVYRLIEAAASYGNRKPSTGLAPVAGVARS